MYWSGREINRVVMVFRWFSGMVNWEIASTTAMFVKCMAHSVTLKLPLSIALLFIFIPFLHFSYVFLFTYVVGDSIMSLLRVKEKYRR